MRSLLGAPGTRWLATGALFAVTLACNPTSDAPISAPPPLSAVTPPPAPTAPAKPAASAARLRARSLDTAAKEAALGFIAGTWQLVGWVDARGDGVEISARARPDTHASAEVWHFADTGRFRRTIGDDFAASGRWSVEGSVSVPERLEGTGATDWWLLALEDVRIAALPTDVRPREWALMGRAGQERLVFYLGKEPVLSDTAMGARCVPATVEGSRR